MTDLLADNRTNSNNRIDAKAEEVRLRYITGGSGQAATYTLKQTQAQAYKDAGYAGTVPALIQGEATARGITAHAACDLILGVADAWQAKAAQIESARIGAKVQVAAATDYYAIIVIEQNVINSMDAM